jgi:integrase
VTRDDVVTYIEPLRGEPRFGAVTALRSLFGWAKRSGDIFRDPTSRIHVGRKEHRIWRPLSTEDISNAVTAATTPQARVFVALAAIHAARPHQIRAIGLRDVDLADRRITLAGNARSLDDLTHTVLGDWLSYRARRWPGTANQHLLISKESALHHGPVSGMYIRDLRGLPATLDRLRIDRQLDEAIATGADPLHLTLVFGISDDSAIRYAVNARKLLERPHEATASTPSGTQGVARRDDGDVPLGSR